jgi:hypothetical protein
VPVVQPLFVTLNTKHLNGPAVEPHLCACSRLDLPLPGGEAGEPPRLPPGTPFRFCLVALWWNGRHAGLRNRFFGVRVQISRGPPKVRQLASPSPYPRESRERSATGSAADSKPASSGFEFHLSRHIHGHAVVPVGNCPKGQQRRIKFNQSK